MTAAPPDRRLHAYREDLAAEGLRGLVDAPRYVQGDRFQVAAPSLPLRRDPRGDAPLETEALFGEAVRVFDIREGWGWAQLEADAYVGYLPVEGLRREWHAPTHRLTALRSFVYPAPDIKTPPLTQLSLNALVAVEDQEGRFLALAGGGYLFAGHAASMRDGAGAAAPDFVAVAERFLGTPYLWGGKTSLGIDCSGLVQLSLQSAGRAAPRDTDMQFESLGELLEQGAELRRGDLVFWPGHVGIMRSGTELLHANAYHMMVASEALEEAKDRIVASGDAVLGIRRLVS